MKIEYEERMHKVHECVSNISRILVVNRQIEEVVPPLVISIYLL